MSSQWVMTVNLKEQGMINEYTIGIAIAAVVLVVFFGGWSWLTSRGKDDKVKAKKAA